MLRKSALELLLSTEPVEPDSREFIVTPLVREESEVARLGLDRYLSIIYSTARKRAGETAAVSTTQKFLASRIDSYRSRAEEYMANLMAVAQTPEDQAVQAVAITKLMLGQRFHRLGQWPHKKQLNEYIEPVFFELMSMGEDDFFQHSQWAFKRSMHNRNYWEKQLVANRGHRVARILSEVVRLDDVEV